VVQYLRGRELKLHEYIRICLMMSGKSSVVTQFVF